MRYCRMYVNNNLFPLNIQRFLQGEIDMNKTFYQYVMTYRSKGSDPSYRDFAEHLYHDGGFPKHSTSYDEISQYLETNSPTLDAIAVFDELWRVYEVESE